jgi:hypothetical protein
MKLGFSVRVQKFIGGKEGKRNENYKKNGQGINQNVGL